MFSGHISYKNSSIAWYRFGTGPIPVLGFHGYGESGRHFSFLESVAGRDYSFFALDLPFHGETTWKEKDVEPMDLQIVLEKIPGLEMNAGLVLMGYSMGARIALAIYPGMENLVKKIILIAPDGLKVNPWYWLATQTKLGNRLFAFTMKNPGWFFGFLKMLNRLKLVNSSIFKFVDHYIGNQRVREALYQRWTGLRKFKPLKKQTRALLEKNKTSLQLLYGKYDRIITPPAGEEFCKGIKSPCTITIIDAGHQLLNEKHSPGIITALVN